jgi:hypothetical protein
MHPHRTIALTACAILTALAGGCRPKETPQASGTSVNQPPSQPPPTTPQRHFTSAKQNSYAIRTEPDDADRDEVVPVPPTAAPGGDNFRGTARKAAKLSIAAAPVESFNDVKDLIASLAAENSMKNHNPAITTDASSNRVSEEKRNVKVRTFLYAASKENDNDFHLILGRSPNAAPEMYMTMELSGLPPSGSPSFAKLDSARSAFKSFFGSDLPGSNYDFYDPPIPVEVEGSLFFDMSHANGSRPGPSSLRSQMPAIWEVHPITRMVFEP